MRLLSILVCILVLPSAHAEDVRIGLAGLFLFDGGQIAGNLELDPQNLKSLLPIIKIEGEISDAARDLNGDDSTNPIKSGSSGFLTATFDRNMGVARPAEYYATLGKKKIYSNGDNFYVVYRISPLEIGRRDRPATFDNNKRKHSYFYRLSGDFNAYVCSPSAFRRHRFCFRLDAIAKVGVIGDGDIQGRFGLGGAAYYQAKVSDAPRAYIHSVSIGPEIRGEVEGDSLTSGSSRSVIFSLSVQ